ncbi:hypothetical protein [Lentilitoribacter sp. EG35]|uniref:hypothetical protein n=1 Tax=Lentilitoribacter sp. EG35 TaxID=3234192 RepID=UPI00345F8F55
MIKKFNEILTVLIVVLPFAHAPSLAQNSYPEVCSAENSSLGSCPQTCLPACQDVSFSTSSTEVSDMCDKVIAASAIGKSDQDFCDPNKATTSMVPELAINENWYEELKAQCRADIKIRESNVNIKNPIPSCAGNFDILECQINGIVNATQPFSDLDAKFSNIKFDENMCKIQESDFTEANTFAKNLSAPLGRLEAALDKERSCHKEVGKWIEQLQCDPTDNSCSVDAIRRLIYSLVAKLDPSVKKASKIPLIIRNAESVVKRIENGYSTYQFAC